MSADEKISEHTVLDSTKAAVLSKSLTSQE
jgi:hypothetical protein